MTSKKNIESKNNFFARFLNFISLFLILLALILLHKQNKDYYLNYVNFINQNGLKSLDPNFVKNSLNDFEKVKFYKVIDGDTIKVIELNENKEYKVRLIGIDTPESTRNPKLERDVKRTHKDEQTIISSGLKAKEYTYNILKNQEYLYLEYDINKYDKYGRILAYVYLSNGCMLNLILVVNGYAKVYTIPPNVKYSEIFKKANEFARNNRLGLYNEF
ncbi:MAG: thermonuclease family protein [bacterium]|nr:thermonuclease family protein [bacterium]